MEALKELVFNHRCTINKMRTNVNDDIGYFGPKRKPILIKGVYSNTIKEGRMLKIVQEMVPDANVTELCLNRQVECKPHRDKGNYGPSYVLFLGTFEGGALCFETGERYDQRGVWQGPFLGSDVIHWNEPITSGTKYSVVAYNRVTA